MTVMLSMLRRHGATMAERHGRQVPVHFGSVASEEAIWEHVPAVPRPLP